MKIQSLLASMLLATTVQIKSSDTLNYTRGDKIKIATGTVVGATIGASTVLVPVCFTKWLFNDTKGLSYPTLIALGTLTFLGSLVGGGCALDLTSAERLSYVKRSIKNADSYVVLIKEHAHDTAQLLAESDKQYVTSMTPRVQVFEKLCEMYNDLLSSKNLIEKAFKAHNNKPILLPIKEKFLTLIAEYATLIFDTINLIKNDPEWPRYMAEHNAIKMTKAQESLARSAKTPQLHIGYIVA